MSFLRDWLGLGVSSRKVHSEEVHVQDRRDAENKFICALVERGVSRSDIFCGLRVADDFQTRKHDIDLVILTGNGIYVIEVKTWYGIVNVSMNGNSWIQHENEHVLKHDNILEKLRLRSNLLRNHLISNNVFLPEEKFHPYVVFMNDINLSDDLASLTEIILPGGYNQFLKSFQVKALDAIPGFFTGQLSYREMDSARAVLKSIGTWDVIQLNGGKQLVGDLKSSSQISPNRQETEKLQFVHQGNLIITIFRKMFGYPPQVSISMLQRDGRPTSWEYSINIPLDIAITFRIREEEMDRQIQANDIDYIQLSICGCG